MRVRSSGSTIGRTRSNFYDWQARQSELGTFRNVPASYGDGVRSASQAITPSRPELHHTYSFAKTEKLSGLLFDVRARFGVSSEAPKPGSDPEHVQALLRSKGYQLPAAMMNVRFVHLFDEQKRKELMIIYAEDLAPTGFTVEDLLPTGKHSAQWPSLEAILLQRAKNALDLSSE